MRVLAIITEYNPFHNGHLWQITQAREKFACDAIVIVQSGAFVQRGEPALIDKWTRAKMALLGGADIVLELNNAYALAPAARFAKGAVELIKSTKIVTDLCFGAETADLDLLSHLAQSLDEEKIRSALQSGKSYPEALSLGAEQRLTPNDILGMEYLRALEKTSIRAHVLPRKNGHNESKLQSYTSAGAIREALLRGKEISSSLPYPDLLGQALEKQGGGAALASLSPLLFYKLRMEECNDLPEIGKEGLENRLLHAFKTSNTLEEALQSAKTRRYTMARIKRCLCMLLLGRTQAGDAKLKAPDHLRLLGFRKEASQLLRRMQQEASLPLVNKVARAPLTPHLELDIRAQNLWALSTPTLQKQDMDYTTSPVIL